MVQTTTDILRLAAQTIIKNFTGDPLSLQAFLNSVELLEKGTEAINIDILKQFVLTKLEGKDFLALFQYNVCIQLIKTLV